MTNLNFHHQTGRKVSDQAPAGRHPSFDLMEAFRLDADGLVSHLMRTDAPLLDDPALTQHADDLICPISYVHARRLGINPAGFILLEEIGLYVTIETAAWPRRPRVATHRGGLEMQMPIGRGLAWSGGWPAPGDAVVASTLHVSLAEHRFPETVGNDLWGRPVSAIVDHHDIPGDLIVRRVTLDKTRNHLDIRFRDDPPLRRLQDLDREWRTGTLR